MILLVQNTAEGIPQLPALRAAKITIVNVLHKHNSLFISGTYVFEAGTS
jgi:hypothetical protein